MTEKKKKKKRDKCFKHSYETEVTDPLESFTQVKARGKPYIHTITLRTSVLHFMASSCAVADCNPLHSPHVPRLTTEAVTHMRLTVH